MELTSSQSFVNYLDKVKANDQAVSFHPGR